MLRCARLYINENLMLHGDAATLATRMREACDTAALLEKLAALEATQVETDATIEELNKEAYGKSGGVETDLLKTLYDDVIELMGASGGLKENEKTIQQKINSFLRTFKYSAANKRCAFSQENHAIILIDLYAKWLSSVSYTHLTLPTTPYV